MLNKDKLILVAYIDVSGNSDADASSLLQEVVNRLEKDNDGSILYYVIPVRGEDSRLECINPMLVSEEEYEKAKQACEKIYERLKELSNDEN